MIASDLVSGTKPSDIIAFTFTEKAADELLVRIHTLVKKNLPDLDLSNMYVGTIHGWCFQYLLEKPEFYNSTPLDELHTDVLISRLYDTLELEKSYGLSYPYGVTKFLSDLNLFYNEHLDFDDVPSKIKPSIVAFIEITKKNRLMTYGEMIRSTVYHLGQEGPISELKHLYIDEYQDVNPAQVELIKAMVQPATNISVVGDDMQCIYQWRGSDVGRIVNFPSEFKDASVHHLKSNYRSRPPIVELANAIANTVSVQDSRKAMAPKRIGDASQVVGWVSVDDVTEQAITIADIVTAYKKNGVPLNCISILLRSVYGSGRPIIDELIARGIDVECPILNRGGEFINDFLIPLFNWLRKEPIPPKSHEDEQKIESEALAIWAAAQKWVGADISEEDFWLALEPWSEAIDQRKNEAYDIRNQLYRFLDACYIRIAPEDSNLMVGIGLASQIIRSVEEIHRRRLSGEARKTIRQTMSEAYFALIRNQETFGESMPINTNIDGVLITTIHQAKGLEWPIVIVPSLVERKFPIAHKGHGTSFDDSVALRYGTTVNDERRLFYVAITRARERLFLLDYSKNGHTKRSRFLDELALNTPIIQQDLSNIDPSIWRVASEDILDKEKPPLRVGLSDLLLYLECPFQFGLRRVAGIQPSIGDELGFGKGLHEIIQRRSESAKSWSEKELKDEVTRHVILPYMSKEMEIKFQKIAFERVKKLDSLGVIDSNVETEVPIEVIFDHGILSGTIDYLRNNGDGTQTIIDWKSNIHEKYRPRYEKQLQVYTYAIMKTGSSVRDAQMIDVGASSETGKIVSVGVNLSPEALDELIKALNIAVTNIVKGDYPANPIASSCDCCDMYRICLVRANGIKSR